MKIRGIGARRSVRWAAGMVALVGGGLYLARASTVTRPTLTFAGTLTQNGSGSSPATMMFQFKKGGAVLCTPQVPVSPTADGAFQAQVPIDACPGDLFDGQDVLVDVSVDGVRVASDQPVSPVPYAKYADRAGTSERASLADALAAPDCPIGYAKAAGLPNPSNPLSVLCRQGVDEVVKVGLGPSAFWIDRYEATVNTLPDGSGVKNAVSVIPANGQWTLTGSGTPPGYALSMAGEVAAAGVTWFQANAFCALSGKRLPTGDEWLQAAVGTPDPQAPNSINGPCLTGGTAGRLTGLGGQCASHWGAQDMIGNLWEMTTGWLAGTGSNSSTWPSGYGGDVIYGVTSSAILTPGAGVVAGVPAIGVRGGGWSTSTGAGVFALATNGAPSRQDMQVGFRCVIPR